MYAHVCICRVRETSSEQSSHEPTAPGPFCCFSITPPCRTRIQDAVHCRSLADSSQGVLVKAMSSKNAQRLQRASTAPKGLTYMSSGLQFFEDLRTEDFHGLDVLHPDERRRMPTQSPATHDCHLFGFTGIKS